MSKVLFVATVVKTHINTFHVPYLKMFKEMGWQTAVAARNDYENPQECVIPYCDDYYDIPFVRSPLKVSNYKAYKKLKRIIDEGAYDIIHCHTPVGAALTRLAAMDARKRGTKVIYTAHGFHFYSGAPIKNWLLYYPAEKLLAPLTDALITINREDYARAQKFGAKKVYYVPGVGIDTARFGPNAEIRRRMRAEWGIPEDTFVILSVGEVAVRKNHQVVIRALQNLERCCYVICGSGPLLDAHKKLAQELGVENRVVFAGYQANVADFYRMADVFAFPSLQEGLPVALMEAMASELPVICSKIRGNMDLIEHGVSGYIAENTPEAIAEAVCDVQRNKFMYQKFAENAALKVKNLDSEVVRKIVTGIYQDTLKL